MMGHDRLIRREFLGAALAGTAGVLGLTSARAILNLTGLSAQAAAAEPPPETTTIRMAQVKNPSICTAAQSVAELFLQEEGFAKVQTIETDNIPGLHKTLAAGEADISTAFSAQALIHLDRGDPIVVLAGGHIGCFELFGSDRVRAVRDLKGKTVAVRALGDTAHIYLASVIAYIGLDPRRDVTWVTHPQTESAKLLAEGKIDALMAFPPLGLELRAKKIGHVLVNSMTDRPWVQYFCCMPVVNREFLRKHPVATKRWLRAYLRAADVCARQPARAVRFLVDTGRTKDYSLALQALKEIPYDKWREYDPEDTLRFYGLRLKEAGMINGSPRQIIARGTDWRFLNELKRELRSRGAVPRRNAS